MHALFLSMYKMIWTICVCYVQFLMFILHLKYSLFFSVKVWDMETFRSIHTYKGKYLQISKKLF